MPHDQHSNRRTASLRLIIAITGFLATLGCVTVTGGETTIQTFVLDPPVPEDAAEQTGGPVVLVAPPRPHAGYGSRRMVYTMRPYELGWYAFNEWSDSPQSMLAPFLVRAIEASGRFDAVVDLSNGVHADIRLDTEIVALHQEFTTSPSQGRVILRVQLIDLDTRSVIASRVFEEIERARTDDPYGGVSALNVALGRALNNIAAFCAEATSARRGHMTRDDESP